MGVGLKSYPVTLESIAHGRKNNNNIMAATFIEHLYVPSPVLNDIHGLTQLVLKPTF